MSFHQAEGPLASYRRTVEAQPLGAGQYKARQVVELKVGLPWWSWLLSLPLRFSLGRAEPERLKTGTVTEVRLPWWAPPQRLDRRQALVMATLAALVSVQGFFDRPPSRDAHLRGERDAPRYVRAGSRLRFSGTVGSTGAPRSRGGRPARPAVGSAVGDGCRSRAQRTRGVHHLGWLAHPHASECGRPGGCGGHRRHRRRRRGGASGLPRHGRSGYWAWPAASGVAYPYCFSPWPGPARAGGAGFTG